MAGTIRIGMFNDRGWAIDGQLQTLNPNYLPVDVTSSTAETFTASYRGVDYVFPIADLALFLDRSYQYIPYPSYVIIEQISGYMHVGETRTVKVRMKYSNGTDKLLDLEESGLVSSNPDILKIEEVEGTITLTALSKGEVVIRYGFDTDDLINRSIIVLDQGENLFAQSNFVGLFPNGIN